MSILFAGLAAVAGGCVDNDISITITKFIPPMSPTSCVFSPQGDVHLSRGIWDVALAQHTISGYGVGFVVSNNLPQLSNVPIQTQAYFITGYDVMLEVEGTGLSAAIPANRREFSYHAASLRLEPGGTSAASIEAIPADLAGSLASLSDTTGVVVAHIRAVATRAEEQVTSAYASFPIQICKSCLLTNADGSGTVPSCLLPLGTLPALEGNPCNPAQDDSATCCVNAADALVCGPNAISKM